MIDCGRVQGSTAQATNILVGKDTVYVRSNIVHLTDGKLGLSEYDEIQYDKDEYLALLSQEKEDLKAQLSETKIALTSLHENWPGGKND